MNTRTVLLWHNNGEERIYFTVNPARLTVTRPNENRVRSLAMGGTVNIWGGRGLREVRLTTFLPSAYSPFFDGKEPESILAMLKSWQDSGDPVSQYPAVRCSSGHTSFRGCEFRHGS